MGRLDIEEYRRRYLSKVEEHLFKDHSGIDNFTPQLLSDAIREELNRADTSTWTIEVADNFEQAVCEAEERIVSIIESSKDLGYGHGSVVGIDSGLERE